MTWKEYQIAQQHLPLATLRSNWGKIQAAVQKDLMTRHGAGAGGRCKLSGKVNAEGLISIAHVRAVKATEAEIQAQAQRDSATAARHQGKLAELASIARDEGNLGLDLFALVAAADAATDIDIESQQADDIEMAKIDAERKAAKVKATGAPVGAQ